MRRCLLPMLVLLGGCPGSSPDLAIDLRTDYVPLVEFTSVETVLYEDSPVTGEGERREADAAIEIDYFAGARIAEFNNLKRGTYLVRTRLLGAAGATVAQRSTRLTFDRSYGLTVMITRDCAGVICPLAGGDPRETECHGGRCAPPECSPADPASCPDPECEVNTDCPTMAACAPARCSDGECLYALEHDRCGPGMICHPVRDCEPLDALPDAGPPPDDAGPPPDDGGPPPDDAGPPPADGGPPGDGGPPPSDGGPPTCPGECSPGATGTDDDVCGDCGTHRRTRRCGDDCMWGAWGSFGACTGEGRCTPDSVWHLMDCGSTSSASGMRCGSRDCICQADCDTITDCSACVDVACTEFDGSKVCAGESGYRTCPRDPMAVQPCTCSSGGSWTSCAPGCIPM